MQLLIYVAAPWKRKDEAREAKCILEKEGFIVTSRWIDLHGDVDKMDPSTRAYIEEQSIHDVEDVYDADVLVLLNLEKSEGKACETGMALAEGIPVILVGERTNIFHWLPVIVQVDNLQGAISQLKEWSKVIDAHLAAEAALPFTEGEILSPIEEA